MNELVLVLPLAMAAIVQAAPAARVNHAELLRKMPAALLDQAGGAYPDVHGMVGHNREGFKASAFQRGATLRLAIAAARGDERRAEDCWRAVEATFVRQTREGHFGDPASSVAFWLCELNRALLVVRQSPLAGKFEDRIESLLPRLRCAADWLAGQREVLFRVDGNTPNRLFFDAEAFALAGLLLGDEKFVGLGKEFLARGLKLYRAEDGVLLEHGGGDSSYQAVCLLRLQEIVIHYPDREVEEAIRKGMGWELGRIGNDGTISTEGNTRVRPGGETFLGREKQVNVPEVLLALLYYHARTDDRDSLQAAQRIVARRRASLSPQVR